MVWYVDIIKSLGSFLEAFILGMMQLYDNFFFIIRPILRQGFPPLAAMIYLAMLISAIYTNCVLAINGRWSKKRILFSIVYLIFYGGLFIYNWGLYLVSVEAISFNAYSQNKEYMSYSLLASVFIVIIFILIFSHKIWMSYGFYLIWFVFIIVLMLSSILEGWNGTWFTFWALIILFIFQGIPTAYKKWGKGD